MRVLLSRGPSGEAPPPAGARLCRTCLGDVVFLRDEPGVAAPPSTLLEAEAYGLLLEVVAGLRSPFVGETQVQGQFKAFLAALDPKTDGDLLRVGQRVLGDAKAIRTQHFQGWGADAYGSLVAERVARGRRVVLVGTGALASEIAEHLPRDQRIDRWGRTPQPTLQHCFFLAAAATSPVRTDDIVTLIVAAPVQSADLSALLSCYPRTAEV